LSPAGRDELNARQRECAHHCHHLTLLVVEIDDQVRGFTACAVFTQRETFCKGFTSKQAKDGDETAGVHFVFSVLAMFCISPCRRAIP